MSKELGSGNWGQALYICDREENFDFMERSDIHVQSNCRD